MTTSSGAPSGPAGPAPEPRAQDAPACSAPQRVCGDDVLPTLARWFTQRADCCTAPAAYRVVIAGVVAAERAELLLCGHHYRASTSALLLANAIVYDRHNRLIASRVPIPDRG